jgi:hypothetical protein
MQGARSGRAAHFARRAAWLLATILALPLAGCRSPLTMSGPYAPGQAAPSEGLVCYLPKDAVEVTVAVRERRGRCLAADIEPGGKTNLAVREAPASWLDAAAAVALRRVPDPSARYVIRTASSRMRQAEVTVDLAAGGLLRSANAASAGTAGEVIRDLAKVGGIAAGTALGVLAAPAGQDLSGLVPSSLLAELAAGGGNAEAERQRLARLPPEALYFLQEDAPARTLWGEMRGREAELAAVRSNRVQLLTPSFPVNEGQATALRAVLDALAFKAQAARQELEALRAEFDRRQAAFLAARGVGLIEEMREMRERFEIDELPDQTVVTNRGGGAVSLAAVQAALRKDARWARAAAFLDAAGVVLTLSADPPPAGKPGRPYRGAQAIRCRPSRPAVLSTYVRAAPAGGVARVLERRRCEAVAVMDPRTPAQAVPLRVSWWGSRKTGLATSEIFEPSRLTWSSDADAARASAGLAEAAVQFREQTRETLAAARRIQDDRLAVELHGLDREIEETRRRRELLEERVALQSVDTNFDLLVETRALEARLAYLEARRDILQTQRETIEVLLPLLP